jgi:cold shock CspA family protein
MENQTKKVEGTVGKIYYDKGYCFIQGEDKRDYFAHYSFFLRSSIAFRHVREGMKVSFTPLENEDPQQGPKATQISLAN